LRTSKLNARFSALVFRIAILAMLAAGAAVAPFRTAAQAPASAARPEPAAAAKGGSQPEAAKPEEGEDVYRHSGLVKSAAKALHLGVETTARIFEGINFAIIVLAIGIPLVRFMPRVFRKRSQTLRHDLESARRLTEDANSRLSAVEAKLTHLDEEIAKFRVEVEAEMRADQARIKAALEEESVRIVSAAEQEIGLAGAQARRGLRHFAADLAIEQAARQMVLTPETDRALIAEFVSGVALDGKTKGGQN